MSISGNQVISGQDTGASEGIRGDKKAEEGKEDREGSKTQVISALSHISRLLIAPCRTHTTQIVAQSWAYPS